AALPGACRWAPARDPRRRLRTLPELRRRPAVSRALRGAVDRHLPGVRATRRRGGIPMKLGGPTVGLSEAEGGARLRAACAQAGYQIVEDYPFDEDGVQLTLDGWDPRHRVGYEYITREGGDLDQFRSENIGKLVRRMERGELHLLLIDGVGHPDQE